MKGTRKIYDSLFEIVFGVAPDEFVDSRKLYRIIEMKRHLIKRK
jgi:hypothetical protein